MRVNGEEVDTREWHLEGEESDRRGVWLGGREGRGRREEVTGSGAQGEGVASKRTETGSFPR